MIVAWLLAMHLNRQRVAMRGMSFHSFPYYSFGYVAGDVASTILWENWPLCVAEHNLSNCSDWDCSLYITYICCTSIHVTKIFWSTIKIYISDLSLRSSNSGRVFVSVIDRLLILILLRILTARWHISLVAICHILIRLYANGDKPVCHFLNWFLSLYFIYNQST